MFPIQLNSWNFWFDFSDRNHPNLVHHPNSTSAVAAAAAQIKRGNKLKRRKAYYNRQRKDISVSIRVQIKIIRLVSFSIKQYGAQK